MVIRRNQFMSTPSAPAKRYLYTYLPGILDLTDPTVIRGQAIAKGARVRIARELSPRMKGWTRTFCTIQDIHGNVQNVFRKAVTK